MMDANVGQSNALAVTVSAYLLRSNRRILDLIIPKDRTFRWSDVNFGSNSSLRC